MSDLGQVYTDVSVNTVMSGAGSRIPRRRGANPPQGTPTNDFAAHFPKNCMVFRKFWAVGGAPLNPPLDVTSDIALIKLLRYFNKPSKSLRK